MKPASFRLARPTSIRDAVEALAEHGDAAKVLAGGQSLIPAMNFRLAHPEVLLDISRIEELGRITADDEWLTIGAGVTQRQLERSPSIHSVPALAAALPWVGHLQTRNRGTVVGSLAHADPAAELPAVAVALDAEIEVQSAGGSRTVAASDFFLGPFTTALRADELATAVRFRVRPESVGHCDEVVRRHGDFAIAGIVVAAAVNDGVVDDPRICAFGVGSVPERLPGVEQLVSGNDPTALSASDLGEAAAGEVSEPWADIHGSSEFRRGAVGALVARAVAAFESST